MGICLVTSSFAYAETLEQYAQKCDLATGTTVSAVNCDAGTEVPTTGIMGSSCDRPNQLNQVCDPGSRFQVLTNTTQAYVVAHCRKKGLGPGLYGDIAVIQHNRTNGATCFYQALGNLTATALVPAPKPSNGTANFWLTPGEIQSSDFRCGGCHDNGPIIRSPYLSQIIGSNALPGAGDDSFNRDQPYYFVGADFASWKAYKVEVSGNTCNNCHRMGVSNILASLRGTARDFGIRATAASQINKNPHSAASPIWMTPGQITYNQTNADFALAIKYCAEQFNVNALLPNTPECKITQFTRNNLLAAYSFDDTTSLATIAKDDTGHGYDGVLPSTGATSVPGKIGSALHFLPDNNIQEFSVQSNSAIVDMNVLEEMTGIAWVKPMGTQQSTDNNPGCTQGTIFSKGGSYWFQLSQNNKQIHFQNEGGGTELAIANYPANGGTFPLNQWTQIAFVRGPWDTATQSQSIQLYVNGAPVPTQTGGLAGTVDGYPNNNSPVGPNLLLNPAASNNSPLMVGNYGFLNDPGACEFNGDLDEINIYDVALSAAEIMSQYQSYPAIVIRISPATPVAGQLITLKAEVTGYSPTGTVQFKVNNVNVGSPVTLTNGVATLTTSLNSGANAITATYSGDANNATSTTVTPFTVTVSTDGDIPTLPQWATIILASLLLGTGVWKLRISG